MNPYVDTRWSGGWEGAPPKTLPAGDSGKVPVLESTEH